MGCKLFPFSKRFNSDFGRVVVFAFMFFFFIDGRKYDECNNTPRDLELWMLVLFLGGLDVCVN